MGFFVVVVVVLLIFFFQYRCYSWESQLILPLKKLHKSLNFVCKGFDFNVYHLSVDSKFYCFDGRKGILEGFFCLLSAEERQFPVYHFHLKLLQGSSFLFFYDTHEQLLVVKEMGSLLQSES